MLVGRGQNEQAWAPHVLHWRWVLAAIVAAVAGCRHAGASAFENSFPTVLTPTHNKHVASSVQLLLVILGAEALECCEITRCRVNRQAMQN